MVCAGFFTQFVYAYLFLKISKSPPPPLKSARNPRDHSLSRANPLFNRSLSVRKQSRLYLYTSRDSRDHERSSVHALTHSRTHFYSLPLLHYRNFKVVCSRASSDSRDLLVCLQKFSSCWVTTQYTETLGNAMGRGWR